MNRLAVLTNYVSLLAVIICLGLSVYIFRMGGNAIAVSSPLIAAIACFVAFLYFDYPRLRHLRRIHDLTRRGLPATARLIKAEQTGRYMNLRPQLHLRLSYIHPNTGKKVTATTNEYVEAQDLAALRPGAVLSIRVDPDATDNIILL